MRRIFILLFAWVVSYLAAAPVIDVNKKYRINCIMWPQGCVVDGYITGVNPPVYYETSFTEQNAAYWYFKEVSDGQYTIQNAASMKYLTYDGQRTTYKRYVDLTSTPQGKASYWTVERYENSYIIRNVYKQSHVLDVRTDSYIVGTYAQYGQFGTNEQFMIYDESGKPVKDDENNSDISGYLESLTIDGRKVLFDQSKRMFYHTVSEFYREDSHYTAACLPQLTDASQTELRIDGEVVGNTFTFRNFRNGTKFKVTVNDKSEGTVLAEASLVMTFLPLVEITGYGFNSYMYQEGTFRVTDADVSGDAPLYRAKFRYRGATASGKAKKAFAVKLIDDTGLPLDASFFGLRSDNNWILDAMAIDPGRMRNRVTTDLWNDFSEKPYHFDREPEAHNGTRGRFVEIFLNGSYHGLYCMTEKLDRKQLKLKKLQESPTPGEQPIIRGALYKSSQWSYSVFMGHEENADYFPMTPVRSYNNNSETWDSWEMKYPDIEDGEPIDWGPLASGINVVAAGNKTTFMNQVGEQFDLPVFLDYYLMLELILATDNHGKNMYLYHYNQQEDKMLGMAPWDLDGTWGRRWDGSNFTERYVSENFVSYLWQHEHGEHTLYRRLMDYDYEEWNESLAKRYAALRKTYFDEEQLYQRFVQYVDLFQDSGADQREIDRWDESDWVYLDFEEELSYLKSWIHDRLVALDKQYQYDPDATGTDFVYTSPDMTVSGGKGFLIICSDAVRRVSVYTPQGTKVLTVALHKGVNKVPVVRPGIYIVAGCKAVVR